MRDVYFSLLAALIVSFTSVRVNAAEVKHLSEYCQVEVLERKAYQEVDHKGLKGIKVNSRYYDTHKLDKKLLFWLNMGIGGGKMNISEGTVNAWSNLFEFAFYRRPQLIKYRYLFSGDFRHAFIGKQNPEMAQESGILYGLAKKGKVGYVSIEAGISRVRIRNIREDLNHTRFFQSATGIPVQAQAIITLNSTFGFDGVVYTNFNPIRKYSGVILGMIIGILN